LLSGTCSFASRQLPSRVAALRLSTKPEATRKLRACEILNSRLLTSLLYPGKRFNAAAFDAKVTEGNSKFQQAIY
jgi:hypothetical protein